MSALGVIVEWSVSGDGHKRGLFLSTAKRSDDGGGQVALPPSLLQLGPS